MKHNFVKRITSFVLALILLVGVLPTTSFATEEAENSPDEEVDVPDEVVDVPDEVVDVPDEEVDVPDEEANVPDNVADTPNEEVNVPEEIADVTDVSDDIVNITDGRTFTLYGRYYDFLTNHSEYGKKDYLAYEWEDEFVIWFFDNIGTEKFTVWDKAGNGYQNYFGIRPYSDMQFTSYIYDRETLELRSTEKKTLVRYNSYAFTYIFIASFDIYWSLYEEECFYDRSGTLPAITVQNPPEDVITITMEKTFSMDGKYLWLLQNLDEYGKKDYLAYTWGDDLYIFFFDNISNVKFYAWNKSGNNYINYFGIRPSANVSYTAYVYNKNTLKFKRTEEKTFEMYNGYGFTYNFIASFDIFTDLTHGEYFYDLSGTLPGNPVPDLPEDTVNFTNGRTFVTPSVTTWLLTNLNEDASKDYITNEWRDFHVIWLFDDISDVQFSIWDRQGDGLVNYFGLKPSEDVTFTEYLYNKNTMQLKSVKERTIQRENEYTFTYYFSSSFDIYTDKSYTEPFYDKDNNLANNPIANPVRDFKTVTNGKSFLLKGEYSWLITNNDQYGTKDYMAYEWGDEFIIFFFDDISNVKFSVWDKQGDGLNNYFGINASEEIEFKEYIYDKNSKRLKSVKIRTTGPSNDFVYTYYFAASFNIYMDQSSDNCFYRINGDLPSLPGESVVNPPEPDESKFYMPEVYCNAIKECPEYKQGQRYLSYLWGNDFVIWFFDDPEVKFSVWDRRGDGLSTYFGVNPSVNTKRKAYVYNKDNLKLKYEETVILGKYSGYTLVYDFVANLDIYTDETYTEYFYKGSEESDNVDTICNVTGGKTFAIPDTVFALIQNLQVSGEDYASENYLAYAWEDDYILCFFDDITDIKFRVEEKEANQFGVIPSSNVQVTEYRYDRITLEFKGKSTYSFGTSNEYTFGHKFMADIDIYTDDQYQGLFYSPLYTNMGGFSTYQYLSPKVAKDFLEFISNATIFDNVKTKLPEYYELLTGEIEYPDEEMVVKEKFLTYFYYCMNIQLASCGKNVDFSKTALIKWLNEEGADQTIISEILNDVKDSIGKIIAVGVDLPPVELKGVSLANEFQSYSQVIVHSIGGIDAVRTIDNIEYLHAYKELLDAIEEGNKSRITTAEKNCALMKMSMPFGGNTEEMEAYARYIYLIEKSLSE